MSLTAETAVQVVIPVTREHIDGDGDAVAAAIIAAFPGATAADAYLSGDDDELCAMVRTAEGEVHLEFGPDADAFAWALDAGLPVEPCILTATVTG